MASLNTMPTTWNLRAIKRLMAEHGLENGNQLAEFTGLTVATAYNVLKEPAPDLDKVQIRTAETLQAAFGLPDWWQLTHQRKRPRTRSRRR